MSPDISEVRLVQESTAARVVPDPSGYTTVSPDWSEVEYRGVELAGDSLAGIWEGGGGEVSFSSWPYTEFCVLLEGHIIVTDKHGETREFTGGEAFVIPKGFEGSWRTVRPSRKYFVAMR